MTSTPLVSVIVPAFNAGASIGETLDSALAQTYPNIEIIVVNDGSSDDTMTAVTARARLDPRVRVVEQQNQGVASARNFGVATAKGELIAPLDADDIWDRTKLARQVQRMQECGESVGFVYSWWVWIDEQDRILDASPKWRIEGRALEKLLQVNFTGNASVPLYRRRTLTQAGGYNAQFRQEGAQGCEDWDLALRVAEKAEVACVPSILVGYRRRGTSMSAACHSMWRSRELVMKSLEERQPHLDESLYRQSADQIALHLAGVSFWSGSYAQAVWWTLRGWRSSLRPDVFRHLLLVLARSALRPYATKPATISVGQRFDESAIPDPLLPYDQIWERRWAKERLRQPDRVASALPHHTSPSVSNGHSEERMPFKSDGR
jgi:glycosyltransferase involved in cell wall biosynthesis